MKQIEGIWLPRADTHFQAMFSHSPKVRGKATYQYDKLHLCLTYCREFRVAVDIGAHVGLWSIVLTDHFSQVIAFEPVFAECFRRNLEDKTNVTLHNVALSNCCGTVTMESVKGNSGLTHVAGNSTGKGRQTPVTSLDRYGLEDVDFIKVDVEGWEYPVLCGARETLLRCKPVVIFEQKGHDKGLHGVSQNCVEYLRALGAQIFDTAGKDIIMGWRNAQAL